MNHEIYLRCHTHVLDEKPKQTGKMRRSDGMPKYVLMFDTETTRDSRQSLNFGAYQFCEADRDGVFRCLEEGLFHADDLDEAQTNILRKYVAEENRKRAHNHASRLKLYDRSTFVEEVLYVTIQANGTISAFHLPFDSSRVAVDFRPARGTGGRGWSLVLYRYQDPKTGEWLPNTFRPRVQLKPKDSKAAFIRLAGGDMNQPYRIGRFLDVKTLVWALRNKSLSLESACREFKVPGKLNHTPTGRVTRNEISYCRQDVRATIGLLNALLREFKRYPVGNLPPEKAYSAASIAKAFLAAMGVIPPLEKFRAR